MTLPTKLLRETENQTTHAEETSWLEQVADLWEARLPYLRKKQSTDIIRPNKDQYGFQEEEEVDQTGANKLGAAILREIEETVEQVSSYNEEEDAEGRKVMENSEEKGTVRESTVAHENCKWFFFL